MTRQKFVCVDCGLRFSGWLKPGSGGAVFAYDRSPDGDDPVMSAICLECAASRRRSPRRARVNDTPTE